MENGGVKLANGYHNHQNNISHKIDEYKIKSKDVVNNIQEEKVTENFMNGPNQIIPANNHSTSSPNGHVKLRVGEKGIESEPPISVPGILNRTVARYPDNVALASKNIDGTWNKITYREYQQKIYTCAKAFLKLGLQRHHSVCIIGFNSPEWFISDLAAIHAGGIAAGIYTTNSPEACLHVLNNSKANIVVVQDTKQMDKVLSIWDKLPLLKAVIQWEGEISSSIKNTYTWEQLLRIGEAEMDTKLNEVLKSIAINECCTLVYTSGTVGNPKGVMLSHDNLVWESYAISERINAYPGSETIISFLPLSHVAAQMVDIYLSIYNAGAIYFADKDALKGSLVQTLQEVQPTLFMGVPRVWEKIYEKMTAIGATSGLIKRLISGWAKQQSLNHHNDQLNGIEYHSYGYSLAKLLVLRRVKEALGFKNCRFFVTAAAPLSPEIKRYFLSLDVPIMDVFGMSEASGAHTLSVQKCFSLESVGRIVPGVEMKFDNLDPQTGQGEICMRGRHVFMGYLDEVKKTEEALDDEGWLHSGDIGKIDEKELLYITGRIKEIIITAGGENVAPVPIEQVIKSELPFISHAMVIGDRKKFLSVLLTFKTEIDAENGSPLDILSHDSIQWLNSIGVEASTVTEVINRKDDRVTKAINDGIARTNKCAISNAQRIQKFIILPADFSIHTGELGPTMKMKRNVVVAKYDEIIESLYN